MLYSESLFLDNPVGLDVWLLTRAAGQSHPDLVMGVHGP